MTDQQLALDWTEPCNDWQPSDRPPTRFDTRQHEMWDIRGQGIEDSAFWTAHDVPTGDLL